MKQALRKRLERLEAARVPRFDDPPRTEEEARNVNRMLKYFSSSLADGTAESRRQWYAENHPEDPYPWDAQDKRKAEDVAAGLTTEDILKRTFTEMHERSERNRKRKHGRS